MSESPSDQADEVILACMPTSLGPASARGSTESTCDLCGCGVHVSPGGRATMERYPTAKTRCLKCAMENLPEGEKPQITPEIMDDVRNNLIQDEVERRHSQN